MGPGWGGAQPGCGTSPGSLPPDAGRTRGHSRGDMGVCLRGAWRFTNGPRGCAVREGLRGPGGGPGALRSPGALGPTERPLKCPSTRGSGEAPGLRRPRGLGSPRGGPGNVPSVRAAPGLLSALSCTFRATHGARESWPGQEPRQARRQQPATVLDTVVTHRSIIYAEFRFSLEWLKLESGEGHSVCQPG